MRCANISLNGCRRESYYWGPCADALGVLEAPHCNTDCPFRNQQQVRRMFAFLHLVHMCILFSVTALEAGLMHIINFRKGCYQGNEVLSKMVSTNAIRRRLCALEFTPQFGAAAPVTLLGGDILVDADGIFPTFRL